MEKKPHSRALQGAPLTDEDQDPMRDASPQPLGVEKATPAHVRAAWLTRAEVLHSTYIETVIEAGDFCPWARGARIAQRSRVHALWLEALPEFIRTLPNDGALEVWQIVVPDAHSSAMQWREYVATLERHLRRAGVNLPWAFAAFHPNHPGRPESIGGAIGILRRSPLPALQLVHLDVLARIRRHSGEIVESLAQRNRQKLLVPDDHALAKSHAELLAAGELLRLNCGVRE